MRRSVLLLVSTVLAVLLASGVAYAAVIKGTPGDDESLDGTPRSDTIYGYAGLMDCVGTERATRLTAGAAVTSSLAW